VQKQKKEDDLRCLEELYDHARGAYLLNPVVLRILWCIGSGFAGSRQKIGLVVGWMDKGGEGENEHGQREAQANAKQWFYGLRSPGCPIPISPANAMIFGYCNPRKPAVKINPDGSRACAGIRTRARRALKRPLTGLTGLTGKQQALKNGLGNWGIEERGAGSKSFSLLVLQSLNP
jgi:hypothetical protein